MVEWVPPSSTSDVAMFAATLREHTGIEKLKLVGQSWVELYNDFWMALSDSILANPGSNIKRLSLVNVPLSAGCAPYLATLLRGNKPARVSPIRDIYIDGTSSIWEDGAVLSVLQGLEHPDC